MRTEVVHRMSLYSRAMFSVVVLLRRQSILWYRTYLGRSLATSLFHNRDLLCVLSSGHVRAPQGLWLILIWSVTSSAGTGGRVCGHLALKTAVFVNEFMPSRPGTSYWKDCLHRPVNICEVWIAGNVFLFQFTEILHLVII